MRVLILVFVFLSLMGLAFAQALSTERENMVMTRNFDPVNYPEDTYEDYLSTIHNLGEYRTHLINTRISEGRNRANFLIIVRDNIYSSLQTSLQTYQDDLSNEGFNSILVSFSGASHIDLKTIISSYYISHGIMGAILVGNLPAAWYEYEGLDDEGEPNGIWSDFPCELFFADMNGTWTDADNDGKFDLHINGTHPEIWISRIKADNLPTIGQSEISLITSYFLRNHQHRTGILQGTNQALLYVDDDWQGSGAFFLQSIHNLYPNTTLVNTSAETNAPDYLDNRLPGTYEFIQVMAHSSPTGHQFKVVVDSDTTHGYVYSSDLPSVANSKFYNLFACSNARFTQSNCMGSVYLLGNNYTLNVVGTSKTGSMLEFSEFYNPLAQQQTFGEAYKDWWAIAINDTQAEYRDLHWFYGNLLLGDCSLRVRYSPNGVTWSGAQSNDWHTAANWSTGVVPNTTVDVLIPSGLDRYPSTASGAASCRNIQISTGAQMDVYNGLHVFGDISNWGNITLHNSSSFMMVAGYAVMGDNSVLSVTSGAQSLYFEGDLLILNDAMVNIPASITFGGSGDSNFVNHSYNTAFSNMIVQKSGNARLTIDASCSEDFEINGHIQVSATSVLENNYAGTISLFGNVSSNNTTVSGFRCMSGSLELSGNAHSIILPHSEDRLNGITLASGGSMELNGAPHLYGDFITAGSTSIIIGEEDLIVDGNFQVGGSVTLSSNNSTLSVGGNLVWKTGSTLNVDFDAAEINCSGNMEFKQDSHVILTHGIISFIGSGNSAFINYEPETQIHNLRVLKYSPYKLDFSSLSNSNFTIGGSIWNYANSTITYSYSGSVTLLGNLTSYNSSSEGIRWGNGTLRLSGADQSISIANSDDYLHYLSVYSAGTVTMNSDLNIRGFLLLYSGSFIPGAHVLKLGGNFNKNSAAIFDATGSTVQLNGNTTQTIPDINFNILQLNKPEGSLTLGYNRDVTAQHFKYYMGSIVISGGSFTAYNLLDNGIIGNYILNSGSISLHQNSARVIDLDADITINGGSFSITGGYFLPANWAFVRDINLTMRGGTLSFPAQGVHLTDTGHSINLDITGGSIITEGPFIVQRSGFNPESGNLNMIGSADCQLRTYPGSSLFNVTINKSSTRNNSVTLSGDTEISGDLVVQAGTLALGEYSLSVDGETEIHSGISTTDSASVLNCNGMLTLKAGSASQFSAGIMNLSSHYLIEDGAGATFGTGHTLCFVGGIIQIPICYSSTINLRNVSINKTANFVQYSGSADHPNYFEFGGTLNILAGNTLRLVDVTICNAGTVTIAGTLYVAGQADVSVLFMNHDGAIEMSGGNLDVTSTYTRGASSILNLSGGEMALNRTHNGTYYQMNGDTSISGGTFRITSNGMQLVEGCSFSQTGGSVNLGWGFKALVANIFQPVGGSFIFTGSRDGSIELASGCYFHDLEIYKPNSSYTVSMNSDLTVHNDFLVTQGAMDFPGTTSSIDIYGNLHIAQGTVFDSGAETIRFIGADNSQIDAAGILATNELIIGKTAEAFVEMDNDLSLGGAGNVTINGGEFRLNSFVFSPSGNITVSSGAKLVLAEGAVLSMEQNKVLLVGNTINPHSRLVSLGSADNPALITCPNGYCNININNYGTVQARYTIFEKLSSFGLNFGSRTALDANDPLAFCTFRNGIAGGRLITSSSAGIMTIPNAVFENSNPPTSAYNVYKTAGTSLNFENASGNFSGEAFEYDPNDRVNWIYTGPPPVPQNLVITASPGGMQLSWDASSGATQYHIYRSSDPDSGWTDLGTTASTVWIDTAEPGQMYFYRVSAE